MATDFSGETKPNRKKLLPPGWRKFSILSCTDEVLSKKGNTQYIMRFQDFETGYEEDVYFVSVKGKRWNLKAVCSACDVPTNAEGHFEFDPPNPPPVVGKEVFGLVEHEPNTYIGRDGVEVHTQQHKIVDFKKPDSEEVQWDEGKT